MKKPPDRIEALGRQAAECVACGRCLAGCPTYVLSRREVDSSRGKLKLIGDLAKGGLANTQAFREALKNCLGCGSCAQACASGVDARKIILSGRAAAIGGLTGLTGLAARDVMTHGPLSRNAAKARSLFFKRLPEGSGLKLRFAPAPLDRDLPELAKTPFLKREHTPQNPQGPRVGLFVGCVANLVRPDWAEAARALLEKAGAQVITPADQVCCGMPALSAGDAGLASELMRTNQAVFKAGDFDYVAAFCGTCSARLKEYEDDTFAARVRDLAELLVHGLGYTPEPLTNAGRVLYHDPCHLRLSQKLTAEPRRLLTAAGYQLAGEGTDPACCGHGGLFNVFHPQDSSAIFAQRMAPLAGEPFGSVVTACSGCLLQFEQELRGQDREVGVLSLAQALLG